MNNIAIIQQGTGRFLFSVPENVTLREGDRVKCSTKRGITDGVAFADSAWVDENVSQLIGKLVGAKFPLKSVVGRLEYLPFEKPEAANPANKYEGMSNKQLDREMCGRGWSCHALNDGRRKHDCLFADYFGDCDVTDANRADVIKYLLAEDAEADPQTQDKQETVKLYCVKDYITPHGNVELIKGTVCTFNPAIGALTFPDGRRVGSDAEPRSYDDWKTENPCRAACLVPLVKRPAKVGEWVLLDKDDCFHINKQGDVVEVVKAYGSNYFIKDPTGRLPSGICTFFGSEYSYVLDGYHPKPEKEPEPEDKQEPIKLYCVKDYQPGIWLTKGKIYEANKHFEITYDDGFKGGNYSTLAEMKASNCNTGAPLFELVKRPAEVGESFLIVANNGRHIPPVEIGSVFVAAKKGAHLGGKYVDTASGNRFYDQHLEYLVLDGYQPEPEAEKEPELEYFSGKVVCVSSGDECFTVGKMYEFINGEIKDDEGDARPMHADERFKSVEEWNSEYGMPIARFVEYKGEAHD